MNDRLDGIARIKSLRDICEKAARDEPANRDYHMGKVHAFEQAIEILGEGTVFQPTLFKVAKGSAPVILEKVIKDDTSGSRMG